jgi:hypothetical protein
MTEVRCVHDLLPGQCAPCKPAPARTTDTVERRPVAWVARYDGWCVGCGAEIEKGRDSIVRDPKGEGYLHEACT